MIVLKIIKNECNEDFYAVCIISEENGKETSIKECYGKTEKEATDKSIEYLKYIQKSINTILRRLKDNA